eukprot:9468616-Pyramimonas_sp.AAC.1
MLKLRCIESRGKPSNDDAAVLEAMVGRLLGSRYRLLNLTTLPSNETCPDATERITASKGRRSGAAAKGPGHDCIAELSPTVGPHSLRSSSGSHGTIGQKPGSTSMASSSAGSAATSPLLPAALPSYASGSTSAAQGSQSSSVSPSSATASHGSSMGGVETQGSNKAANIRAPMVAEDAVCVCLLLCRCETAKSSSCLLYTSPSPRDRSLS